MGLRISTKEGAGLRHVLLAALVLVLLTAAAAETVYGPEWTRTCDKGTCRVSIGEPNLLVGDKYLPFDQAVTIRWENREGIINGFVVYFPEGTITVEPSVTIDKTTVLMSDTAKTSELSAIRATPIIKGTKAYEYALQIDNIPSEKSLDNVLFRLRLDGIREEDLNLDESNSRLIILQKYVLGFEDLKETGYAIKFLDKTTLEITNTAGKTSLLLDPSVSLSGAKVLGDTQVFSVNPTTNYGTGTYARAGQSNNYDAKFYRSFLKFNLTGAVTYNATNTVNDSSVTVYVSYYTSATPTCYYYNLYGVNDQTWKETAVTWNLQPTLSSLVNNHVVTPTCTSGTHAWMTFPYSAAQKTFLETSIRNSTYKNISFGIIGYSESSYWVSDSNYIELHPKEYGSGYEILAFSYYVATTTTTTTTSTTTSSGATTTTTTTTTSTAATTSTSLMLPTVPMANMSAGYTSTLFGVQKQTFFVFVSWLAVAFSLMLFGAKNAGQGLLLAAGLSWFLWAIGWFIGTLSILWVLLITIIAVLYQLKGDRRPLG